MHVLNHWEWWRCTFQLSPCEFHFPLFCRAQSASCETTTGCVHGWKTTNPRVPEERRVHQVEQGSCNHDLMMFPCCCSYWCLWWQMFCVYLPDDTNMFCFQCRERNNYYYNKTEINLLYLKKSSVHCAGLYRIRRSNLIPVLVFSVGSQWFIK